VHARPGAHARRQRVAEVEGGHDWTLRVLLQCAADAGPGAAGAVPAPDEPATAPPAPGRAPQAARLGREGAARVPWTDGAGLGFSAAPRFDPQGAGGKSGADASEPRSPLTAARKGLRASRLAVSSQAERPSTEGPLDSEVDAGLVVPAAGAKAETDTCAAPRPDAQPCADPHSRDGAPGLAPGGSDPSSPPQTPSGAPEEAEALSPVVQRAAHGAGAAGSQPLPVSADASRPQVSPLSTAPGASAGVAGAGQQERGAPSDRDTPSERAVAAPALAPSEAVPVIQEQRNVSFAAVPPLSGSSAAAGAAPPDPKPEPRLWWADQAGTAAPGGATSPRLSRASSFARTSAPAAAAALPLLTPAERAAYVDMLVAKLDALLRAGRAAAGAAASQAASASSASPADAAASAGFVLAPLSNMFRAAPAEGGAAGPGSKLHSARLPAHSLSTRAQLPGAGPVLPAPHAPSVAPAAHGQPAGQAPHMDLPQAIVSDMAAGSAEAVTEATVPDSRSGNPHAPEAAAAAAADGGAPGPARGRGERPRARSPPPSVPARFQHTLDLLARAAERAAPQEGGALDCAPAGTGGQPGAPMRLQVPAAVPPRLRAA